MASASTLPPQALQASRAALASALAEQPTQNEPVGVPPDQDSPEPGEIQEVNMEAQAEGIKTVFNDPTNFNVKVCVSFLGSLVCC
jgi:translation initiation factor 4E